MARNLKQIAKDIMLNNYTLEQWLQIDCEVDELLASSTEEECQYFADSGAGEILDMICAGKRNAEKKD